MNRPPVDDGAPARIGAIIESLASRQPHATAIGAPGLEPLTYAGLRSHLATTADVLSDAGIDRSHRIALVSRNGPHAATAFLAVADAASCAPLNVAYRSSELEFYLRDLRADALILETGASDEALEVAASLSIRVFELAPDPGVAGRFELRTAPSPRRTPERGASTDGVALLLHTSGTTSRPKLVPLTHENLLASAHNVASSLRLGVDDRCLNVMPLFHIHGLVAGVLAPLVAGSATWCPPGIDAERILDWFRELAPTWYTAVPTMHQLVAAQVARLEHPLETHLRFVRSSSSALPLAVHDDIESLLGCPVVEAYGMTEAAHQITTNPLPPLERKPGTVGLPTGTEVAILDSEGTPLPSDQIGEVAIRGPSVFAGYEANDDANAHAFVDGWFRTGDLGRLDADGYLCLEGRIKEIINRGGEKISPHEVEDVLLRHEHVAQAVVFARPHTSLGEDVAAAVVLDDESAPATARSLQEFARKRLAEHKIPRTIVLLRELPKGPTGKLQRIGLWERLDLATADGEADGDRAETALERRLTAVWSSLLSVEDIRVTDDFFTLGGDSLIAAQLFAQLAEEGLVPADAPVSALLSAPTIAELAGALERGELTSGSEPIQLKDGTLAAPLFFVSGHQGRVVLFARLARRLKSSSSCFVLPLPAEDEALSVELIAERNVSAIRRMQRSGPYRLFGDCMGGGVVLEMARMLHADGETVELLGMLDPIGEQPGALLHYWRRWRFYRRRGGVLRRLREMPRIRRQMRVEARAAPALEHAMAAAGSTYRPRPYDGAIVLFRTDRYATPVRWWDAVARGGVRALPRVGPTGVDPPGIDVLADQLDELLEAADA